MAFEKMVKGLLNWQGKYNADFEDVHAQLANKANIQRPEVYTLDLAEGVTRAGAAEYWRNTFDEVTVTFKLYKESGFDSGSHVVATLPHGFHPTRYAVHTSGFAQTKGSEGAEGLYVGNIAVWIASNGSLVVHLYSYTNVNYVSATFSFLAG